MNQEYSSPLPQDAQSDFALAEAVDIPLGSLEAAAFVELPYTFQPTGKCASFYREMFG